MTDASAGDDNGASPRGSPAFSTQLQEWLDAEGPSTVGGLGEVFGEKGFVVVAMLLMLPAALPAPTGGVTHVFEVITALLGLEMIVGVRSIWIPARWRGTELPTSMAERLLPWTIKNIQRLERHSSPRGVRLLHASLSGRLLGGALVAFAAAAFLAPPFSGLDTLPALGAVIFAIGVMLDDIVIVVSGLVVGAIGVGLSVTIGTLAVRYLHQLVSYVAHPLSHLWHVIWS